MEFQGDSLESCFLGCLGIQCPTVNFKQYNKDQILNCSNEFDFYDVIKINGKCTPMKFIIDYDEKVENEPTEEELDTLKFLLIKEIIKVLEYEYLLRLKKNPLGYFEVKCASYHRWILDLKKEKEFFKISFHFVIPEIKCCFHSNLEIIEKLRQETKREGYDINLFNSGKIRYATAVKPTVFNNLKILMDKNYNAPHIHHNGTKEDFLLQHFNVEPSLFLNCPNEKKETKEKKEKKQKTQEQEQEQETQQSEQVQQTGNEEFNLINEFLKQGLFNKYADDFETWVKIGLVFKTVFNEDEAFYLFNEFSKLSDKYDEDECEKKYLELNPNGNFTIGTLKFMAKQSNEVLYFEILNKFSKSEWITAALGGPLLLVKHFEEELKTYLRFTGQDWIIYDDLTGLWKYVPNAGRFLVELNLKCRDIEINKIKNKNYEDEELRKEDIEKVNKVYRSIDTASFRAGMECHCKCGDVINDPDFENKLDKTEGKIVFKNGILDLKTGEFRKGFKYDDFLSFTLDFNYKDNINENDLNEMREIFLKICNNDFNDLKNFLKVIGYALTGAAHIEQFFFLFFGPTASNGKSLIFDILDSIIPQYSRKLNNKTFNIGFNNVHKELINTIKKRIVWVDELQQNRELDVELIKEFSNGTTLNNQVLFKKNSILMQITSKLFITSNYSPSFVSDEGINRRYKQLNFNTKFYDKEDYPDLENPPINPNGASYWRDKNLKNYIVNNTDKAYAFLMLFVQYSILYYKEGLKLSNNILIQSLETCQDNNDFKTFLDDYFIITNEPTDFYPKDMFMERYNSGKPVKNQLSLKSFKDNFIKYGITYNKDKKLKGYKGAFVGIKEKPDENDD